MLIEAFAEQVSKNPSNIAIRTRENEISYELLDRWSDGIASRITGSRGALLFGHGADMIAATLGALKANMVYIPFDPDYPENRLAYMLEDSEAGLIVTNTVNYPLAVKLAAQASRSIEILNIDEPGAAGAYKYKYKASDENQIAYILYTSGSTGKPKGVVQTHKNILHFARSYINSLGLNETDRLTLFSSFSHDAAVVDIFGGLLCGATLYPLNARQQITVEELPRWLAEEEITVWHSVPTLYRFFINMPKGVEDYPKLRYVVLGGENVLQQDVLKCRVVFKNSVLVNLYGQSESSINSMQFVSPNEEFEDVNLGEPIDGVKVVILNKTGEIAEPLREGELVVASEYLAQGYWKDEEKTAKAFIDHAQLGRIYRTGDMGFYTIDRKIEYSGRKDFQVKIRGFRVELEEIENCLLKHELIKEAAVIGKEDASGDKLLHAYIAADGALTAADIRNHLLKELPEYMVPSYFTMLEQLPLTPTGKTDRKALQNLRETRTKEYAAPTNDLERKLADIWKDILGIEKIGINESFFELGGHSLRATVLVSRLHKELDVEVPLGEIFRHSTIKELAAYIGAAQNSIYEAIEPVERKEYYALSSAQKRLYILNQLERPGTSYNIPGAIIIEGKLDTDRLEQVFNELIERHETLRTSFEMVDGEPVQRIHEDVRIQVEYQAEMPFTDNMPSAEKTIKRAIKEFIKPFDLGKAPLLRVKLVKLEDRQTLPNHQHLLNEHADKMENRQILLNQQHLLLVDMHHIIADGVSLGILSYEFVKLYIGEQLPPLRIQYKDYSEWQQGALNTEALKQQEEYWLEQLSGELPVLNMPTDHPRPSVQSFDGSKVMFTLEREYVDRLKQLRRKTGTTLYMILLAAYNVLLSKYTGQEDIIVGSPIADRPHADLENIIGMFVNTLAMRNYPSGSKSFEEFLQEVKDNALKAYDNQDYQFEELVEKLNIRRDISRNPLFDVMFSLQNMETGKLEIDNMSFEPYRMENNVAKFDMTLTAMEDKDKIAFSVEYCTRLFEKDTIQRFAVYYINVLKSVLENPKKRLADIDILTGEERNKLLYEFNDTGLEYPKDKTIHQLFEEQVERTPDNIAVIYGDNKLTYRQLNEKANRLARVLRAKGIGPDSIAGIMVKRSPKMLVGLMAILKAGGAYLPIDPEYPGDRINYMLEDSGAKILLTQNNLTAHMNTSAETIYIDDEKSFIGAPHNLEAAAKPDSLAYVIYTSGSTGKPKGVMIEHKAVNNFIKGMMERIGFAPDKTILALTTISFDIFVLETLLPLCAGLRILLADEDQQRDPAMLSKLLLENDVDMLQITPSRLQMLLRDDGDPACLEKLTEIMIGGEQLPEKLLEAVQRLTAASIYNMYGPTETTVWSSMKKLSEGEKITIGSPIANTCIYITDSNCKLQPIGVAGELCIGGAGLARGYLGRPELTAEKFMDNPFRPRTKMYKTGDLARWLPDGNIEFLGRADHQVKIRGFRIELGEIENRLLEYEAVKEAVAAAREDESGDKYLCAYIVGDGELAVKELREYLLRELPEYMIPSYFMQLEELPLTPNGKIDRKALPKPDGSMSARAEYEAPRNEVEQKLAEIWSGVLKTDRIGINDNFFELGGHSLRAVQVINMIYKQFNIKINMSELFTQPTIKNLGEFITNSRQRSCKNTDNLSEQECYQLSYAQKRLWIINQLEPQNTAYNMPGRFTINEAIGIETINKALRELIRRHESLRTCFKTSEGAPVQVICDEVDFTVPLIDISEMGSAQQTEELERIYSQEALNIFDLREAPLLTIKLVKLSENKYELIYCMHHIISDEWSMKILEREFVALYEAYKLNKTPKLKPLTMQFKDFAAWQTKQLENGEKAAGAREYWCSLLGDELPVLNVLAKGFREGIKDNRSSAYRLVINSEMKEKLREIAGQNSTSLYMVLLTALNIYLMKLTGQNDIVIGTEDSGRKHEELQNIIGCFANTVVLRNQIAEEATFAETLNAVKQNTLKALEYQSYPLEMLAEELNVKYPEITVFFNMLNMGESERYELEDTGRYHIEEINSVKFRTAFYVREYLNGIELVCCYMRGLYKPEIIEYIVKDYAGLLQKIAEDPGGIV